MAENFAYQRVESVANTSAVVSPVAGFYPMSSSASLGLTDKAPETLVKERPEVLEAELAPLSFAQERLWFLEQLEPNSPLYNIPTVIRVTGVLDYPALEQSFNAIVARHEVL